MVSVQGSLAMFAIWKFGSEEQKTTWLPRMATGEAIGCFGLTEADFGSNPAGMRTRAKRDGDDWVINGTKMWITNGSVADVAIVWAQTDEGIKGFIVPTDTPGFSAPKITKKLSLRASVTSELVLENVHLPRDAVLPDATGLRGPLSCLNEARASLRCSRRSSRLLGDHDRLCHLTRGVRPPACFTSADAGEAGRHDPGAAEGVSAGAALGRLKDDHRLQPQQVSLGKLNNVREALAIARECRTILAPAASPWSTRCCVTPTTWNRC